MLSLKLCGSLVADHSPFHNAIHYRSLGGHSALKKSLKVYKTIKLYVIIQINANYRCHNIKGCNILRLNSVEKCS